MASFVLILKQTMMPGMIEARIDDLDLLESLGIKNSFERSFERPCIKLKMPDALLIQPLMYTLKLSKATKCASLIRSKAARLVLLNEAGTHD